MMDGAERQHLVAQPQTTQALDTILFDRAALLMGRSLYWNTSPRDHIAGIEKLLRWCLALPGARLGVSVTGVAQIAQSIFATAQQVLPLSPEIETLLGRFGTKSLGRPVFEPDVQVWGPYASMLLGWLAGASRPDDYVWLDEKERAIWIDATLQSLRQYNDVLDSNVKDSDRLQLMSRHIGTVFAPFDGASIYDHVSVLTQTLRPARRDAMNDMLADPRFSRERLASIQNVYWSWRMLNFSDADSSIICTPMLGIWSEYPASRQWAPPPWDPPSLAGVAPRTQYSTEEIAHLLEIEYWQVLETIFNSVRISCGLGFAEPEFNEIQSRPPVFFFASPVAPPVLPEEYAITLRRAIYPLIKSCLQSNDPLSDQIAWGLLEGDLVALRREMSTRRYYQSRYLVLPTVPKSSSAGPVEDGVGDIAEQLTYLEFSMGHEVRDVYTDMDPLAVRGAIWGGTLDRVGDVTSDGLDLLPALGQGDSRRVIERLAQLNLVLRRVQALVEKGASDSNQVERNYKAYLDGTDDFMRRVLTSSSVPHSTAHSLRDAVLSAYPYQYIKQPLESLQSVMSLLRSSVERISTSLKSVLEQADREANNRQAHLNGVLSILLALVGLLVGLLQVGGSQFGKSTSSATPVSILTQFFQLPALNNLTQDLVTIVSLGVVIASLTYVVTLIATRVARKRHRFIIAVQQLRQMVDTALERVLLARTLEDALDPEALAAASRSGERAASAVVEAAQRQISSLWAEIERLDGQATDKLAQLWKDMHQLADSSDDANKHGARAWMNRARVLEHMIELFDLSPQVVPLPRMLCVLRFKSTEFRSRTTVSDWDFESSLGLDKFTPSEAKLLDGWLSAFGNPKQIRAWDVATFARVLDEHGVSASPQKRNHDLWQGSLEGADKPKQAPRS